MFVTFWCLSQARTWISNVICCGFLFCIQWVKVRFIDIDGIADHYCLNCGLVDHYCLNCLFGELRWEVIVRFVYICGLVDHYCLNSLFVFGELRWEVIVRFVYICGLVDHYCLNSLFVFRELRWEVIVLSILVEWLTITV